MIDKKDIKILLVDDDSRDREIYSEILRKIGYSQIKEVENSSSVIDTARNYQPDLILMDTQMPGICGYEVCRQIRQEDFGKDLAIIGMSAGYYRTPWLEAGANDFLDKFTFFEEDALDARIQKVLEGCQGE